MRFSAAEELRSGTALWNEIHRRLNAMIRQSGSGFGGSDCGPDVLGATRCVERLSGGRLGDGRNRRDRLQDLGSDLVGVALRVRTAVFEIALVAAIGEAVGYADRGAAVRDAISEVADRSGLVLAGQAH